ncbi:FtsK/SpoIIIE domain-containing protein, partial [Mycolicibacterium fortuitum]
VADLATFNALEAWASSAESALQIPLGLAPNGIPVTLDFTPVHDGGDGGHGLIQGATGSGKSTALATMVLSLCARYSPDRVNFVLVSRCHTFRGFEALPHVQRVFDGRDAAVVSDLVGHLNASVEERVKLIADSELQAFDLESSSSSAPLLFVVIDDVEPMLNGGLPGVKLYECLDNISREGRALQINLLLATQRTSCLPTGFPRMMSYRVALATLDAVDSRAVIGTDEAKFLPKGNGAAIITKPTARPSLPRFEFFNVQAVGADGIPIRQALIARIAETATNDK